MLRRSLLTAVVAATAIGLAACGDDNNDSGSSTPAAAPPAASTTATAGGTTVTISADPGGALSYDTKSLSVKAGDITIDFKNQSSVPHNVTIEQGEDEQGATDTIQGSSTSKSFNLKPGTYAFYCSVDGHEAAGMKGTLVVQ